MRRFIATAGFRTPTPLKSGGSFRSWPSLNQSLSSLLKKRPINSHLHEARRLHALLLVSGVLNPNAAIATDAGSRLVEVYAHLGNLQEAVLVFRRLHCADNLACNAILRAYLGSSQFSQAIHFFNHLVSELGLSPDNYTCPLVLKACSGLFSLEDGRRVLELIRFSEFHHWFKPNVYTKCALIDMFAKCGSLDDARKVFDEMRETERDLASWTAIICGTIHQGNGLEALYLFNMMRLEGKKPDSVVMSAILPACGRLEARKTGMALQGCALKSGFYSDLFVSNALVDMYCKFGDTGQAYSVFCRMLCKDDVSWRTLIAGYSQNSQYDRSLELYREMINVGIKPSAVVVASILPALGKLKLSEQGKVMHGFVLKQGFDSDIVIASALIDMYSNCGLMAEMQVLLSMSSDWDVMIWNSVIAGYAIGEDSHLALTSFRQIWNSKLKPNSITLVSILPICTKIGALKQGMEVHCHAIRSSLTQSISVSNSLIDMYCKCGYLRLGVKLFHHMIEKDTVSYNTLISAYGFHSCGKQALILFDEMKSLAITPTKATFIGLLSACSHAGLVDQGWSLYHSMINDYGISPDMEHYSCMVDMLGRAGRIDDACNFVRTMPDEPDANVLGCLLAACRIHNITEDVNLLEAFHDKFRDSGYHILMSNIYASTKKWEDASRVRALIKEKGLKKKPGNSWIQIGHCTHVFDVRDTTHLEFCRIQEVLEILFVEMKGCYGVDPVSLP